MPDAPETAPPAPRKCPECGYLLIGLPGEGRCPECGWAYDNRVVVLFGQPFGKAQRGPMMAASREKWFYATLLLSVGLGGALWGIAGLPLGVLGACVIGAFGLAAWFGTQWAEGRRERQQVRITPEGVAVRTKLGNAAVKPWIEVGPVQLDYEPTPPPGWLSLWLPGTPRQRRRRWWWRVIGVIPVADALRPEELPGVETPVEPDAARQITQVITRWATDAGGETKLTPRAQVALDLDDSA